MLTTLIVKYFHSYRSSSSSMSSWLITSCRRSIFPLRKRRSSNLSSFKDDLLALRMSPPALKHLSTAAELGMGVLYFINRSIHISLCWLGKQEQLGSS